MKRKLMYLLGICILLLALVGCNSSEKAVNLEFTPYEQEDGAFYVDFPGIPEVMTETVPTPVGDISFYMYLVELDNSAFSVAFNDYPEEVMEVLDPTTALDDAVQGAVASTDGTLIEQKDYSFEGNPGKEFKYTGTESGTKFTVLQRAFIVDNRLYQLQIISESDKYLDYHEDFFNSFKLSK